MRIGIVGCGLIGQRRAQIATQSGDTVVIAADPDLGRAKTVASAEGTVATKTWQEVVRRPDVDAIVVSTTNDWLSRVTVAALRSGKHVLCEKPLGRNPAEVSRIVKAATIADRVVKAGFNHRFKAAISKAHDVFASGVLGAPIFLRCRYGHGGRVGYEKEWRLNVAVAGGGELLDQGIHVTDLFRWFLGDFVEAFGYAPSYVWKAPSKKGARRLAEDNGFALFRTKAGQVASLHASWTQWKNLFSFEAFCERGYVVANGLGGSYGPEQLIVGKRKPESGPPDEETTNFSEPDASWTNEWHNFARAISTGAPVNGSALDGLRAMQMVHGVYQSQQTHAAVQLKHV